MHSVRDHPVSDTTLSFCYFLLPQYATTASIAVRLREALDHEHGEQGLRRVLAHEREHSLQSPLSGFLIAGRRALLLRDFGLRSRVDKQTYGRAAGLGDRLRCINWSRRRFGISVDAEPPIADHLTDGSIPCGAPKRENGLRRRGNRDAGLRCRVGTRL